MHRLTLALMGLCLLTQVACTVDSRDLRLTYDTPGIVGDTVDAFVNALPLGNGRLGASIYGQPTQETITINEDSIWSGPEQDRVSRKGLSSLSSLRTALLKDRVTLAAKIALANLSSDPLTSRHYMFMADLTLDFDHGKYSNYFRYLDMQNATVHVEYDADGHRYTRDMFSSYPAKVIVMKLASDSEAAMAFSVGWRRTGFNTGSRVGNLFTSGSDSLIVSGHPVEGSPPYYVGKVTVKSHDGIISAADGVITVKNASEAILFVSVETDYWNDGFSPTELEELAAHRISRASSLTYSQLYKEHTRDFRGFFDRTSLDLTSVAGNKSATTEERYDAWKTGTVDLGLVTAIFQFGRYILISSSRAGSLPPTLVGIWNNQEEPPWGGKFTLDLNVEMNHWLTELVGLSELHQQLFDFTQKRVVPNGQFTAKVLYNCSGWVAHSNNDLWGDTAPHDNGTAYTFWPSGGAWPMTHLFEHWRFTGDSDFLRKQALPILTGLIEFFNDYLIDRDGYLVTAPSLSPENHYITPEGVTEAISIGPTSDNQILREIYNNFIYASAIVGSDNLVKEAKETLSRLRPPVLDNYFGGIRQWWSDWEEGNNVDGMMAPLLGLHPFAEINLWDSHSSWILMAEASLKVYQNKARSICSWCVTWPIIYYARLHNSNMAWNAVDRLLSNVVTSSGATWTTNSGNHQVDGNLGVVTGIAEMLLQSHGPEFIYPMYILPALPSVWPKGSVANLGARGGFDVSIEWSNGVFRKAVVHSKLGRPLNVTVGNLNGSEFVVKRLGVTSAKGSAHFQTGVGENYTLERVERCRS